LRFFKRFLGFLVGHESSLLLYFCRAVFFLFL
jgi:hypothetical protein